MVSVMSAIDRLTEFDPWSVFLMILLVAVASQFIIQLFSFFWNLIKKKTDSDYDEKTTIENMQNDILMLKKDVESIRNELNSDRDSRCAMQKSLDGLRMMLVKKEIDDYRWELLNFANAVINGTKYNKEQYDHVLEIHTQYKKILEENNMENGRVTASMAFVENKYRELMECGFEQ